MQNTMASPSQGHAPIVSDISSLLLSFLEPNWLILCSYLSLNVCLTHKVLKVAVNREQDAFQEGQGAASDKLGGPREETPVIAARAAPIARFFIGLSAWAFRADARNAKRLIAILALVSLASTWYFMFAFLHHSYISFVERCHLSGCRLPPLAPNVVLSCPSSAVPALHLRVLRISQWLGSISLFKEAWMEVIKDPLSWWWSSEICLITVGPWALFLSDQGKRLRIRHVWAYMAVGQLVAISFAFNLFNLAIIYRLIVPDFSTNSAPTVFQLPKDSNSVAQSRSEKLVTTVITRKVNLPSNQRRLISTLGSATVAVLVAAGVCSVYQHPDSFFKVMLMHVFPMIIALSWHTGQSDLDKAYGPSIGLKKLYMLVGAAGVCLRIQVTCACLQQIEPGLTTASIAHQFTILVDTLFRTTFLQHPAQSSISSDHVSVAVSTLAFIAIESGVWLWRIAVISPTATRVSSLAESSVYLDSKDRQALETQAAVVLGLLLVSPLLGVSATLSFYLALRCDWIEKHEQHQRTFLNGSVHDVKHDRDFRLLSKEKWSEVIETEEGVRVRETRETFVRYRAPVQTRAF